jgi:D-glycero-alpha-D-manno-heptose-7-phosphate kinase
LTAGGDKLLVRSIDYDTSVSYSVDEDFVYDGQLDLAKGVLEHFREQNRLRDGLEIVLHNDAPPGSGLGSSSAITVALVAVVAEHLRLPMDSYQLASLAYDIERHRVGIQGGKQDQYAAAFGGFNFLEFYEGRTVVNPLRLRDETICELEYCLVFAYVGGQRLSSRIIEKQVENYRQGVADSVRAMDELAEMAILMKEALLLGRVHDLGGLLDAAWASKKRMAQGISNPFIDKLYHEARQAGALGGKISGAGGGGFMFFFCDPRRRFAVQDQLRQLGAQPVNLGFVEGGCRTWRIGPPGDSPRKQSAAL